MSRGRMTMRADVERDQASGEDAYGGPLPPDFQELATLPCFVWSRQSRQITDGDKTVVVEDLRALFPLEADIREGDEIAAVQDRQGAALISGRLRVDAPPQRKHRHVEVMLRRVG